MFQLCLGKCCNIKTFQDQPFWQHRAFLHTVKQQVSSQREFRKIIIGKISHVIYIYNNGRHLEILDHEIDFYI